MNGLPTRQTVLLLMAGFLGVISFNLFYLLLKQNNFAGRQLAVSKLDDDQVDGNETDAASVDEKSDVEPPPKSPLASAQANKDKKQAEEDKKNQEKDENEENFRADDAEKQAIKSKKPFVTRKQGKKIKQVLKKENSTKTSNETDEKKGDESKNLTATTSALVIDANKTIANISKPGSDESKKTTDSSDADASKPEKQFGATSGKTSVNQSAVLSSTSIQSSAPAASTMLASSSIPSNASIPSSASILSSSSQAVKASITTPLPAKPSPAASAPISGEKPSVTDGEDSAPAPGDVDGDDTEEIEPVDTAKSSMTDDDDKKEGVRFRILEKKVF
jgi:hypothetical protein